LSALVDRSAIALSLILGVALVPACMKKAGDRATAPTSADAGEQAPTRARDPLAELDHLEGRMRELGVPPAKSPATETSEKQGVVDDALDEGAHEAPEEEGAERAGVQTTEVQPTPAPTAVRDEPSATEDENRCTTVCALNEQICELEVQICSMAKNHDSDPIYSDACERAVDDCELSGDACDTCVE
jgi:hypothetical protein